MKRKLLVIFFIVVISSIIIYKYKPTEEKVLFIGEKEFLSNIQYKAYKSFLYENITYKELINSIKNNDYIVFKNKKIYLNQLISDASVILIGVNNKEYNKYCNNDNLNMKNYIMRINNNKKSLNLLLKKITSSKVVFLDNNCINN